MSIHTPTSEPLSLLDFEILHIKKDDHAEWYSDDFETVAVLIEGLCVISADGQTWRMRRRSVFDDAASAIFVSPGISISVDASEKTVIALCKARADKKFKTVYIPPEQVVGEWRGKGGFKRKVFNIVNTEIQTQRIAVGETINEPGEWSSFPPHKHDTARGSESLPAEAQLEEIYYFRIEPETGFGFQRLYTEDKSIDESYVIKDGDITHIPRGYHPVANIPGHRLYYLWMLAGEKRIYLWNTDPKFQWMS